MEFVDSWNLENPLLVLVDAPSNPFPLPHYLHPGYVRLYGRYNKNKFTYRSEKGSKERLLKETTCVITAERSADLPRDILLTTPTAP